MYHLKVFFVPPLDHRPVVRIFLSLGCLRFIVHRFSSQLLFLGGVLGFRVKVLGLGCSVFGILVAYWIIWKFPADPPLGHRQEVFIVYCLGDNKDEDDFLWFSVDCVVLAVFWSLFIVYLLGETKKKEYFL